MSGHFKRELLTDAKSDILMYSFQFLGSGFFADVITKIVLTLNTHNSSDKILTIASAVEMCYGNDWAQLEKK